MSKQKVTGASVPREAGTCSHVRPQHLPFHLSPRFLFLCNSHLALSSFSTRTEKGRKQPLQYAHLLHQADVSPQISQYHHSLVRVQSARDRADLAAEQAAWQPRPPAEVIRGRVPAYCTVPSSEEDTRMQAWIKRELNQRCHQTRLAVQCVGSRTYTGFIPCPQELSDDLAEDYANMNTWCRHGVDEAAIPMLVNVDAAAAVAFRQASAQFVSLFDEKY